jgi:ssDNA-binding Zn-finger/Zn-ribbon topoisomerase 1
MKKLIEASQKNIIECDNPKCDFVIPNETGDANADGIEYVNVACPKCGENLLTEKDYLQYKKVMQCVNWLNKYFSWLTVFSFNNKITTTFLKVHNGIKQTKP